MIQRTQHLTNQLKGYLKQIPAITTANRLLKARLQERTARLELQDYQRSAQQSGIQVLEGSDLQAALDQRLARRDIQIKPRNKGNLHVYLAYREQNWESSLPVALQSFGQVSTFETLSRGFDEQSPHWLNERDEMNRQLLTNIQKTHAERPIDIMIGYLSGVNVAPEALHTIGQMGIPIVNFCWDDKLKYRSQMLGDRWMGVSAIASSVDLNLTNAKESRIKYFVDGGLAMFWPEAADPNVHRRYDVPFDFDATFVGARYGYREILVEELQKQGVHIECFGKGWPNGFLPLEEMTRIYSRSRINIGLGGVAHSHKLLCLKGRDFEVPMSGGLYLAQHNPEFEDVFHIGKEIVTWKDPQDCAETIKRLLNNPDEAHKIREAGYQRSLKDHSWETRFDDLFQFMRILP